MEEFARIEVADQITAIAIGSETLVVGCADSTIHLYRLVAGNSGDGSISSEYLSDGSKQASSTKKPIEALQLSEDEALCFVLCDATLCVFDLYSMEVVYRQKEAKSVSCFDVRDDVCVMNIKKRVVVMGGSDYAVRAEFIVPEPCSSLAVVSANTAVLGFRKEYSLVDLQTGDLSSISVLESTLGPLCGVVAETSEAVLRLDDVGAFVFTDGSKRLLPSRGSLRWTEAPKALAVSYPFLISLESRGLEVHSLFDKDLNLLATVPFKDGVAVSASRQNDRVAAASAHKIIVYTPTSPEKLIKRLISELRVEEAFDLFETTSADMDADKKRQALSDMCRDAGMQHMVTANFGRAFEMFKRSLMDPRDAIALFRDLVYQGSSAGKTGYVPYKTLDVDAVIRATVRSKGSTTDADVSLLRDAARAELRKYLYHVRSRSTQSLSPECLEAVDYALLKLHVEANADSMLIGLLRENNACPLAECETLLRNANKQLALGHLYRSRGRLREALQLWKDLGDSEAALSTIDALSTVNELAVIWKYGKWVFDKMPAKAVRVFTANPAHAGRADEVLDILRAYGSEATVAFLETLVRDEHRDDAFRFHTELAARYIQIAQQLRQHMPSSLVSSPSTGSTTPPQNGMPVIRVDAGAEPGLLGETRSKLLLHLRNSNSYDTEAVLAALASTDLWEERVVVYAKAGMFKEALDGMVYRLDRFEAAERFCTERKVPLTILLQVVLHERERVLALLDRHAEEMPAADVIRMLPDDLPVREVRRYLSRVMSGSTHVRRERLLVHQLARGENLEVQYVRHVAMGRHVQIGESRMCGVCKKRIHENHFVAVYPNLRVVHYSCHKHPSIDPVDGRDFRKDPVVFSEL